MTAPLAKATENAALRRRAYVRASIVMAVVTAAALVALALAFPDAHGRSLPVALAAFERQAWLIVAASIAIGCGFASFVYARVSRPSAKA